MINRAFFPFYLSTLNGNLIVVGILVLYNIYWILDLNRIYGILDFEECFKKHLNSILHLWIKSFILQIKINKHEISVAYSSLLFPGLKNIIYNYSITYPCFLKYSLEPLGSGLIVAELSSGFQLAGQTRIVK